MIKTSAKIRSMFTQFSIIHRTLNQKGIEGHSSTLCGLYQCQRQRPSEILIGPITKPYVH
jgi:hypothetical protein